MPREKGNSTTLKRGFKAQAEKKSLELRKELSLSSSDRLPATVLADFLNIPIYTPQDIARLSSESTDELLGNGSNYWSAVTIALPEGRHLIIHNPKHASVRQESSLMHELAHVICEHSNKEYENIPGIPSLIRNFDPCQEEEAECMGGCLHIPRDGLLWALKRGMTNEEIGEHFHASLEMVTYRINITAVRFQLENARKYRGY